jgi:hypothetical protein
MSGREFAASIANFVYTPSPAEAEFGDLTSGFGTIQLCL